MSGIIGIGLRGLMANETAIKTVSQNIANIGTEFYSRREIDFANDIFNSGVSIKNIKRVYDEMANQSLLSATHAAAKSDLFLSALSDFEKILDNDNANINKFINDSLKSIQDLSGTVTSLQSRDAYLSQLSNISLKFRELGSDIERRKSTLNKDMEKDINYINNLIDQIANTSKYIDGSAGDARAGLLDERNALVHDLAKYIDFDTNSDDSGSLQITLKNGYSIISGGSSNHFSIKPNEFDKTKNDVYVGENATLSNVTQLITSGRLAGMINYRSNVLDVSGQGLDRLALVFSDLMNKQNKLGVDVNGNLGKNIFSDINSAAMTLSRVSSHGANVGSGAFEVVIDDVTKLNACDYRLDFSDPTTYKLTRLSDNQVVSTGSISSYPASLSVDGFSLTISSGTFAAGDSFLVKPTVGGMRNCNMLLSSGSYLALGFPVNANANIKNSGQGIINVDSIKDTSNNAFSINKKLNPPIKIDFISDTTYQLVNANDSSVIEGPITYDPSKSNELFPTPGSYDPGYRVSLTGVIKSGDSFSLTYNDNAVGDNRNALQIANLYTSKVVNNSTFNEAYRGVSLDVSSKTKSATVESETALMLYDQARRRFQEISGVSKIEEQVNLAQYQEAYQANAQIIQVARTIFDTIISISR